jgi:hypothetical protein
MAPILPGDPLWRILYGNQNRYKMDDDEMGFAGLVALIFLILFIIWLIYIGR